MDLRDRTTISQWFFSTWTHQDRMTGYHLVKMAKQKSQSYFSPKWASEWWETWLTNSCDHCIGTAYIKLGELQGVLAAELTTRCITSFSGMQWVHLGEPSPGTLTWNSTKTSASIHNTQTEDKSLEYGWGRLNEQSGMCVNPSNTNTRITAIRPLKLK